MKSLSRFRLFATLWNVAYQAPPSMEFSRQEYWSRLLLPSPGDLPDLGIEPGFPALQADALPSEPPGSHQGPGYWGSKLGRGLTLYCKSICTVLICTKYVSFPRGSVGKEFTCNAGDPGSIPWLRRSSGKRNNNPFQYSCLENPQGQRSLVGCSPWDHRVGHDWATDYSPDLNNN